MSKYIKYVRELVTDPRFNNLLGYVEEKITRHPLLPIAHRVSEYHNPDSSYGDRELQEPIVTLRRNLNELHNNRIKNQAVYHLQTLCSNMHKSDALYNLGVWTQEEQQNLRGWQRLLELAISEVEETDIPRLEDIRLALQHQKIFNVMGRIWENRQINPPDEQNAIPENLTGDENPNDFRAIYFDQQNEESWIRGMKTHAKECESLLCNIYASNRGRLWHIATFMREAVLEDLLLPLEQTHGHIITSKAPGLGLESIRGIIENKRTERARDRVAIPLPTPPERQPGDQPPARTRPESASNTNQAPLPDQQRLIIQHADSSLSVGTKVLALTVTGLAIRYFVLPAYEKFKRTQKKKKATTHS